MGTYEQIRWYVVCDGLNCFEDTSGGEDETQRAAEKSAKDCGFVQRDGKWLCESCAKGGDHGE